eukprot:jgi/Undpi1/13618/HiC_scaffold_9.g03272.m1
MPSAREPGSVEKKPSRSSPSQESWVYSADALQTDLTQTPTEGKNMDIMHGMKVVKSSSKKQAEKLVACTLSCVHGMPNRQGNNQKRRRSSGGRTGCDCKINVRWPAQSSDSTYPRITTMHLEHNHDVNREAVNAKEAQLGALSTPMKETSAKLTDAGMQPSDQAVVLEALHDRAVNQKVMQNAVSQHRQGGREFDAQDLLKKVRECTKDGGVYDVKLENGRLTHCFSMTAEQISLATRYGSVLLYCDTAVKNRYRLRLGLGVVIDGEYFSRIVFQALLSDTKTDTFTWMLEQFKAARGPAADVFTARCGRGHDPCGGGSFRGREKTAMRVAPRPEHHQEPQKCAGYDLRAMNALIARFLNAQASLCSVFDLLSKAMGKARDRAILRSPQLILPSVQQSNVADFWLGDAVLAPCKFALGAWPYRFMVEEVMMASMFSSSPVNAVLEGSDRGEALSKFEYIGMKVVNVVDVALIVENNDGTDKLYVVLGMTDRSHLCSCRTLQELGVCCRHFWAAMRLSRKYKFHVGILNQHWRVERGRKPTSEWPERSTLTWAVAKNHKPLQAAELPAPLAATDGEQHASGDVEGGEGAHEGGVRWNAGDKTIESSLVQLKQTGPTPQDRRFLYVNCLKETTAAVSLGVETVPPEAGATV